MGKESLKKRYVFRRQQRLGVKAIIAACPDKGGNHCTFDSELLKLIIDWRLVILMLRGFMSTRYHFGRGVTSAVACI